MWLFRLIPIQNKFITILWRLTKNSPSINIQELVVLPFHILKPKEQCKCICQLHYLPTQVKVSIVGFSETISDDPNEQIWQINIGGVTLLFYHEMSRHLRQCYLSNTQRINQQGEYIRHTGNKGNNTHWHAFSGQILRHSQSRFVHLHVNKFKPLITLK